MSITITALLTTRQRCRRLENSKISQIFFTKTTGTINKFDERRIKRESDFAAVKIINTDLNRDNKSKTIDCKPFSLFLLHLITERIDYVTSRFIDFKTDYFLNSCEVYSLAFHGSK